MNKNDHKKAAYDLLMVGGNAYSMYLQVKMIMLLGALALCVLVFGICWMIPNDNEHTETHTQNTTHYTEPVPTYCHPIDTVVCVPAGDVNGECRTVETGCN